MSPHLFRLMNPSAGPSRKELSNDELGRDQRQDPGQTGVDLA